MSKPLEQKELVFSVAHLERNLKNHAIKSTKVTMFAQAVKLVIHLSFIAILARLLEPSDYGLFAMVAIFTSLGVVLLDGGLSMATIQRDKITHAQVSNLFWVNAALGMLLALIILLLGPIVSWIYNQDELTQIMAAMALSFVFGGLSIQHDAILRRQMRFKAIAFIDVFNIMVGGIVGIWFAYYGAGYWSLVISYLVSSLISALLKWWFAAWVPSRFRKNVGSRPLINFGANLAAGGFIGYFTKNATPFTLGFIGGPAFLGLYNRTFAIASIPTNQLFPPIMSVLRPTLSRVAKDQERLRTVSISIMSKVALVSIFVSTVIFVSAEPIVLIMLGEKWLEAIPILQVLALMTLATPVSSLVAAILIASGKAGALLRWQIVTFCILVASLLVGSYWGVYGVLYAALISIIFVRIPLFLWFASKYQPVKFIDFGKVFVAPIFIALISVVLHTYLSPFIFIESIFISLLLSFVQVILVFIILSLMFKRTRNDVQEIVLTFKLKIRSKN